MMVMNVIDAEGIPDDLIITREQEFSPLPEHVGDHHQDDIILLLFPVARILSSVFFSRRNIIGQERD